MLWEVGERGSDSTGSAEAIDSARRKPIGRIGELRDNLKSLKSELEFAAGYASDVLNNLQKAENEEKVERKKRER